MGVGGQRHAPAVLPPGRTRYPLCRRLGGPQGRSGRVRKISPPTGIRSPDRPARRESLYRLSYPGPHNVFCKDYKFFSSLYCGAHVAGVKRPESKSDCSRLCSVEVNKCCHSQIFLLGVHLLPHFMIPKSP